MVSVRVSSLNPYIEVSRVTIVPSDMVVVLKVIVPVWPSESVSLVHSVKVSVPMLMVVVSVGDRVLNDGSAEERV